MILSSRMPTAEPSNISANAGDEKALSDPNSPEAIAYRAKKAQAQSSEDQRYDPPPPQGFTDYIIVWEDDKKRSREISAGLFLTLGILLFLYKAAPNSI
jgi:hypothetical protein